MKPQYHLSIYLLLILIGLFLNSCTTNNVDHKVLVFYKTKGFVHKSIPKGLEMMEKLAIEQGFQLTSTDDASLFTEDELQKYSAVVFLNTSGEVFDFPQRNAFKRFIQAGGGFVGIHAATTTERSWPWYMQLVGANFDWHPKIQEATVNVIEGAHPSTSHLKETWVRTDEWYNFSWTYEHIQPLLILDASSVESDKEIKNHPIAWYHDYDGGRSFYTAMGHADAAYEEEAFQKHIWGGLKYAMGSGQLDYNKGNVMPEESRFEKVVLDYYLDEPMELEYLPDGRLIFIERKGKLRIYEPEKGTSRLSAKVEVYSGQEDGLIGMAIDPNFKDNNWLYLFYSHPTDTAQYLSRFTYLPDEKEALQDEKLLLKVKTQRRECCHAGGSLEFGPNANLFISTGDDTNPFASNGYSPSDERPGRKAWDAQRTSANTNDLRGKVLRIKPEADGTYSIPDGNLFPKDGSKGRPEIYVMGCRNPFRISLDSRTGFLYWGDVGPDANENGDLRGPMGHDEVNQARAAGFFGWPYFVGDNKAYYEYDFEKKESLDQHDAKAPINNSPNNTGIQELPPAQAAYIYYPYRSTPVFPLMRSGGRNAMAGPVFYRDDFPDNPRRYPAYYDKKLFTYDWIRGVVMTNRMDEEGNHLLMERFLPSTEWDNLVDIVMSPFGDLYMLEYGRSWFSTNEDARLIHLQYHAGNRKPKAKIKVDQSLGGLPLTVQFDASESSDPDKDNLKYSWNFGGDQRAEGKIVSHEFKEAAPHIVTLTVEDTEGFKDEAEIKILAGNEAPQIKWILSGNQDFFFEGSSVNYEIKISDKEDGELGAGIAENAVERSIEYLQQAYDLAEISMGHKIVASAINNETGKKLMEGSDCQSCHKINSKSIGPSYTEVALKYRNDEKAVAYLSNKIINGGSGVWGETAMAAHPDFSKGKAEAIANYILSLAPQSTENKIPMKGIATLEIPEKKPKNGIFVFVANYLDQGAEGMEPIKGQEIFSLRSPLIYAREFKEIEKADLRKLERSNVPQLKQNDIQVITGFGGGTVTYGPMDLSGIKAINLYLDLGNTRTQGGTIEVYLNDTKGGEALAAIDIENTKEVEKVFQNKILTFPETKGKHSLIFKFIPKTPESNLPVCNLFNFRLENKTPKVNGL